MDRGQRPVFQPTQEQNKFHKLSQQSPRKFQAQISRDWRWSSHGDIGRVSVGHQEPGQCPASLWIETQQLILTVVPKPQLARRPPSSRLLARTWRPELTLGTAKASTVKTERKGPFLRNSEVLEMPFTSFSPFSCSRGKNIRNCRHLSSLSSIYLENQR